MGDEYRITFTVERRAAGQKEFVEIGYGGSGSWSTVDQATHMVDSAIQNREWETDGDMPDPSEVDRD